MVEAAEQGLLADSAMIAHGRGEAFDYLLGEQTSETAARAIQHALGVLSSATHPVISVNGNTVALAEREIILLAGLLEASIEVNLFYRTSERVNGLIGRLENVRTIIIEEEQNSLVEQEQFHSDVWVERIRRIQILGADPDGTISGLEGPRARACVDGIIGADVVLVPLEDGDRCEALVAGGKSVINVDLNPMSRSARKATITIVDEVRRCLSAMIAAGGKGQVNRGWDNSANLVASLAVMTTALERMNVDEVE